jgi:hypothetical protein
MVLRLVENVNMVDYIEMVDLSIPEFSADLAAA